MDSFREKFILVLAMVEMVVLQGVHPQLLTAGPQNDTALISDTVRLSCRFSEPVECQWLRGGETVSIRNRYQYINPRAAIENVADCSIVITSFQQVDAASWLCLSVATDWSKSVTSEAAFISIQKTPSYPILVMNGNQITELNTVDIPKSLCCEAVSGNPPATLHWEINDIQYTGLSANTRQVGDNLYDTEVCLNLPCDWNMIRFANTVCCIGSHPGYSGGLYINIAVNRNDNLTKTMGEYHTTEFRNNYIVFLIIALAIGAVAIGFIVAYIKLRKRNVKILKLLQNSKAMHSAVSTLPQMAPPAASTAHTYIEVISDPTPEDDYLAPISASSPPDGASSPEYMEINYALAGDCRKDKIVKPVHIYENGSATYQNV